MFDFEVIKNIAYKGYEEVDGKWQYVERPPGTWEYTIQLPHSCDNWVIAMGEDKEEVIEMMTEFISEAQEALLKLQDL